MNLLPQSCHKYFGVFVFDDVQQRNLVLMTWYISIFGVSRLEGGTGTVVLVSNDFQLGIFGHTQVALSTLRFEGKNKEGSVVSRSED